MPDPKNLAGHYQLLHQRMHGQTRHPRGSVVHLEHNEASSLLARGLVKPAPASETTAAPPPEPPPPPQDPPPGDDPPAPTGLSSPLIPNKAEKSKR